MKQGDAMKDFPESAAPEAVASSVLLVALSRAFSYPAQGLSATLEALRSLDAGAQGSHARRIRQVISASDRFASLLAEQQAYVCLFANGEQTLAPPYASRYLNGDGRGESLEMEIAGVYRDAGVELDASRMASVDHLHNLLAMSALFARRYEETGDESYAEKYVRFRDAYILSWLPECRALVNRHAELSYYLADLCNSRVVSHFEH